MIKKQHKRGFTMRHARANYHTGRLSSNIKNNLTKIDGTAVIYVGSSKKPLIEMIHDDQEIMRANNTHLMRTLQSIGK